MYVYKNFWEQLLKLKIFLVLGTLIIAVVVLRLAHKKGVLLSALCIAGILGCVLAAFWILGSNLVSDTLMPVVEILGMVLIPLAPSAYTLFFWYDDLPTKPQKG